MKATYPLSHVVWVSGKMLVPARAQSAAFTNKSMSAAANRWEPLSNSVDKSMVSCGLAQFDWWGRGLLAACLSSSGYPFCCHSHGGNFPLTYTHGVTLQFGTTVPQNDTHLRCPHPNYYTDESNRALGCDFAARVACLRKERGKVMTLETAQ